MFQTVQSHWTYEKKSVTSPFFNEPKIFGSKTFRLKKFRKLLLLCLSEKEWNVDRLDKIV